MVDLLFVRIGLGIRLADTFRHNFLITALVTCILAVGALHASSVLQEIAAESTSHNVVEHLHRKLVAVLFDDIFLLLPDGAFTAKTDIEAFPLLDVLDEAERQLNPTNWL